MNRNVISSKCYGIISDIMKIPVGDINDGQRMMEDLGVDSMDGVDIIIKTENAFDIALMEGEVENLSTVGDYVDFVCQKIDSTFKNDETQENEPTL